MRYLSVEEVMLIHEFELWKHGGASGVRSLALLESSIQRPRTYYSGIERYKTIIDKAASLIFSIIKNHPFIDGNKRTALVSGEVFLRINGYSLDMLEKELVKMALDVANNKLSLKDLTKIIDKNSKKLKI
jgi:death-on-curing protein